MSKDDMLAKELAGSLYKESTNPDVLYVVKEFLQKKRSPNMNLYSQVEEKGVIMNDEKTMTQKGIH